MNETEKKNVESSDKTPIIEVNSMHKWYGDFHVLSDINLKVALGERIVICGPSGARSDHCQWHGADQ
jgi:general L-amino acid transport system ATP-binding protein